MAYDDRAFAQAARMLAPKPKGKGQAVTLHQPAEPGSYDEMTDTVSAPQPAQSHDGSGIEEAYDAQSIASGVVLATDVKFVLSPLKVDGEPMPTPIADSWTITVGEVDYTIKRVTPLRPAGKPVLFTLQLRA